MPNPDTLLIWAFPQRVTDVETTLAVAQQLRFCQQFCLLRAADRYTLCIDGSTAYYYRTVYGGKRSIYLVLAVLRPAGDVTTRKRPRHQGSSYEADTGTWPLRGS